MFDDTALSAKLRRSATSVGVRGSALVPLSYGSVAGELAICMRTVGLVDREDLRALTVEADPTALDRALGRRFAAGLAPGEASVADELWGRIDAREAVAIVSVDRLPALLEELRAELGPAAGGVAVSPLVAIGIVGPATPGLLTDLGVYGALVRNGAGGTIATAALAGSPATWMLLDDSWALVLVEPAHVSRGWDEIGAAGRRFGLGYVGAEAAERFELARRQCGERADR